MKIHDLTRHRSLLSFSLIHITEELVYLVVLVSWLEVVLVHVARAHRLLLLIGVRRLLGVGVPIVRVLLHGVVVTLELVLKLL